MITALLLAAGGARRFGAPKLLQDLHGKPVIRWAADVLQRTPVDEVIVVVPPSYDELRDALQGIDAYFVVNPHPNLGISGSLACGIAAVSADTEAVLVALGDEPTAKRSAAERVLTRYREGGVTIVAAAYEGVRGHPVLFDRAVFDELRVFSGDVGARTVVDRDPTRVALVEMGEPMPADVDTPADLARLREQKHLSDSSPPPPPSGPLQ